MRALVGSSRWWLAGSLVALLVLMAGPAAADWREDLAAQLRWDHDCVLNLLSQVIEREVDGQQVVLAKAHCEDGRVFDVLRESEFEDFRLNECTPSDQAC